MMDPLPVVVSVRGLPPALPPNAVHSLMRHLGASHIRLHNRGTAFLDFADRESALRALLRIHQLPLLGSVLSAEFCSAAPGHASSDQGPSYKEHKATRVDKLHYSYPAVTPATVRNISTALMANPSFYHQVLHLMNRMRFPLPFELEPPAKRPCSSTDESEYESDDTAQLIETVKVPRHIVRSASCKRITMKAVAPKQIERTPRSDILTNRLSSIDMAEHKAFRGYDAGEPSRRLYVKNLAPSVDENGLHRLFGAYLGEASADIRLMTEGRMKGRAFIAFPTVQAAQTALADLNGFILDGRPVVLVFSHHAQ